MEYFVEGLTTQLAEVRKRGEKAICREMLVKEHRPSDRQAKALGHILEHGCLTIQHFERLCPEVNRRSLQRDMKGMLDKRGGGFGGLNRQARLPDHALVMKGVFL